MDEFHSNVTSTTTLSPNVTTTTTVMPFVPIEDGIVNSSWPMIAGFFAWTAFLVSVWEISSHLSNYNKPYLQKYIVRILWMVPIYALNSVSFFDTFLILFGFLVLLVFLVLFGVLS